MKKIYISLVILVMALLGSSCNDEWNDEQYEQYISFKAPIGNKGVTDIYVRYKQNGKVTYKLPLIVSGSLVNNADRTVRIAVDPDTLAQLNSERFGREDLYYRELGSQYYDFQETVDIPAGISNTTMDIDLKLDNLNLVEKWVLPLSIVDDPSYNYVRHPRKSYSKALLRILPFNDYSGSYSTTTMQVFIKNEDGSYNKDDAMVADSRTGYVVDENTIFFYAGLVDEELIDRAKYKVYFRFSSKDEGMTVTLFTDDDSAIKLKQVGTPSYAISEIMDATRPYLKHRYITFNIEYDYVDYTSAPGVEIPYKVKGTMILERNINTQIPDEDQAIEW